jgi:DNA-binding GntR family transcriptional regulator
MTAPTETDEDHVPSPRASAGAVDVIREWIFDGSLESGARLKEEELAREIGISRTPIREALFVLQAEGLVELIPNRGAVVRGYDLSDLESLYSLRAVLEGYAARRAAERITPAIAAQLEASCDRYVELRRLNQARSLVEENIAFHNIILAAAQSDRLEQMTRGLIQHPIVYRTYFLYPPEERAISDHYHRQITAVIASGDAARSERLLTEHVLEGLDFLTKKFGPDELSTTGGGNPALP